MAAAVNRKGREVLSLQERYDVIECLRCREESEPFVAGSAVQVARMVGDASGVKSLTAPALLHIIKTVPRLNLRRKIKIIKPSMEEELGGEQQQQPSVDQLTLNELIRKVAALEAKVHTLEQHTIGQLVLLEQKVSLLEKKQSGGQLELPLDDAQAAEVNEKIDAKLEQHIQKHYSGNPEMAARIRETFDPTRATAQDLL